MASLREFVCALLLLINIARASNNIRRAGSPELQRRRSLGGAAHWWPKGLPLLPSYDPFSLPLSRLRERWDYEATRANPVVRSDKNISFDVFSPCPFPSHSSHDPFFLVPLPFLRNDEHAEARSYVISRSYTFPLIGELPPFSTLKELIPVGKFYIWRPSNQTCIMVPQIPIRQYYRRLMSFYFLWSFEFIFL